MHISHLTRIAVNLSLIVALAFQPVAVCLASVDCAADCTRIRSDAASECGCCQVELADNHCCCGVGKSQYQQAAHSGSGCCSKPNEASTQSEAPRAVAPSRVKNALARAYDSVVRSVCLCEQKAPPVSDSSPRRSTLENRDNLLLAWTNLDQRGCVSAEQNLAAQLGPRFSVSSHHSQRMLCIWRL